LPIEPTIRLPIQVFLKGNLASDTTHLRPQSNPVMVTPVIWLRCRTEFSSLERALPPRCVPGRRGYPQGSRRKNLAGWFLKKNLPWGNELKFSQRRRQLLVEVRRGAATCDDPCILDYFCSSASCLACIKALSKTLPNIHGSSHVLAPRLTSANSCRRRWLNLRSVLPGRFKNHLAKFFLRDPWGKPLDSWSLSHLGYLYPGTTPVMIKLDHKEVVPVYK